MFINPFRKLCNDRATLNKNDMKLKITYWHRARPILGTAQVKSVQELKTRASNHTLSKIHSFSVLAKKNAFLPHRRLYHNHVACILNNL